MKSFLYLFVFSLLSLSVCAKTPGFSVSGTVIDSTTSKAIELATVALKTIGEGKIISGVTVDAEGKFLLEKIPPGKYQLVVSFVGYTTKSMAVEVLSNTVLGNITLSSSSNTIGEAWVVGEK